MSHLWNRLTCHKKFLIHSNIQFKTRSNAMNFSIGMFDCNKRIGMLFFLSICFYCTDSCSLSRFLYIVSPVPRIAVGSVDCVEVIWMLSCEVDEAVARGDSKLPSVPLIVFLLPLDDFPVLPPFPAFPALELGLWVGVSV